MTKVRKAIIAAAGFGTRFLPQTKAMPKEMMPIIDRPVIQVVVEELVSAGITDIIIVTGYHKRSIEDHFDRPSADLIENLKLGGAKKQHLIAEVNNVSDMANFIYLRQKGPYGNGTPLLNARDIIGDEPFIYTWSDDFIVASPSRFKQMIDIYDKYNCSVLSCIKVSSDEDYNKYGFVSGIEIEDGLLDVHNLAEKPGKDKAPSDLAMVSGGLYTPDIFRHLDISKNNLEEGSEFHYNEHGILPMIKDGKKVVAAEIKNGVFYDAGDKLEYLKTVIDFGLKDPAMSVKLLEFLKHKIS